MKFEARHAIGGIVAAVITIGVAALSQVPYAAESTGDAVIRLSWRARGERIEECRRPSQEELRSLPEHMRRAEICEGRLAPYALHVELDDSTAVSDTIRASGARQDRPIYVFRELRIRPGAHELHVRFTRAVPANGGQPDTRAVPRQMELETLLSAGSGEVVLITFDEERRQLVRRTSPERR